VTHQDVRRIDLGEQASVLVPYARPRPSQHRQRAGDTCLWEVVILVFALRVLIAVVAAALAFAVPAAADEGDYLRMLQVRWTFLSTQQLLSEGSKVCKATRSGMTSADAVNMVQRDLAVSVPVAVDIVGAAVVDLGC
jgi:hypothetical protein